MSSSTALARQFAAVRRRTVELCAPLTVEDHQVQPMPDASPAKWHLAHTTWFFEALVLEGEPFDPEFAFLFNSYYEALGERVPRHRRGLLTRPSLERVHAYREVVDHRVLAALAEDRLDGDRVELGLNHEQQHQELILTDAKCVLGTQPLRPAYRGDLARAPALSSGLAWRTFEGGLVEIGAPATGFAFDNERPRHRVFAAPFALASRPLTNGEVLAFIADGGYREPRLWLSDGWALAQSERWEAPLYWRGDEMYDLAGVRAIDPAEVACHLSYYEVDAIARWLDARLPTEVEWELAATGSPAGTARRPEDGASDRPAPGSLYGGRRFAPVAEGNFADDDRLHPSEPVSGRMFGDVWQWTSSAHAAYPGYRPLAGALGEYNGKFMSGQQVLRGGSCFTPRDHVRASYRNFFPPGARWQMTGARLARDVEGR